MSSEELDELLAGNRLAGAQYDAIYERIRSQIEPQRIAKRKRIGLQTFALAMVVGAVAVLSIWVADDSSELARRDESRFAAKGLNVIATDGSLRSSGGAVIEMGCGSSHRKVCRATDALVFSVAGNSSDGHFMAFAQRLGSKLGPRIWYFGLEPAISLRVAASRKTVVLARSVGLGVPHRPGRYVVTAWISQNPQPEEIPMAAAVWKDEFELVKDGNDSSDPSWPTR